MTPVFIIGILAGLVLVIRGWAIERAVDVDAFTALDRLHVAGPIAMRPTFATAAAVAAAAPLLGLPAIPPLARATAAVAALITVWLIWLGVWVDLRWMLDAAIVFQDHVPLRGRPAQAFSHAPQAALSFRPFTAAVVLLIALALTGAGFGLLARLGWTRMLPLLASVVWLGIGIAFWTYVRAALAAERRVRRVLADPEWSSDGELFDALRRNPRSARLLAEHARRLEERGEALQALLEYRAVELAGSFADIAREGAARARRRIGHPPGPIPGSIVLKRHEPEARMHLPLLEPPADALPIRVIDPARFLGELLALTDSGLILNVQGEVDGNLDHRLFRFEHLAPLVPDDPARPHLASVSWRLETEVRDALHDALVDGHVPAGWVNVHLYTLDRMLVAAHSHFGMVLAAPDIVQREFIEWRRAAAVGPMSEEPQMAQDAAARL